MKAKKNTLCFIFFLSVFSIAKNVNAQNTTISPGSVLPVMTTAQRTGLASLTNGMLIFDSTTQSYWFRQSGTWVELPKGGSTSNYWSLTGAGGNEIQNTNSGGFWSANPIPLTSISTDVTNPPTAPVSGAGTRMMWIPSRSAFRVGTVDDYYWDASAIGLFSFAAGFNTVASAKFGVALGAACAADGENGIALGYASAARGTVSVAIGSLAQSAASNSITIGSNSTNVGASAMSIGGTISVSLTGTQSMSFGNNITTSGANAMALGNNLIASGEKSTAMGYLVNTSSRKGAFIIGDSDPLNQGETQSGTADQFVARFKNGYYLMTSGNTFATRTGVQIANGQTAWSAISDSTRKEKFLIADGEDFLKKLRNLKLGSWNYKVNKTNPERFYGPMAQEIFAAFGKDKLGTIGNDTTVSTLNMDGLLFIFAQALEKRTQSLQEENNNLKRQMSELQKSDLSALMNRLEKLEAMLNQKEKMEVSGK